MLTLTDDTCEIFGAENTKQWAELQIKKCDRYLGPFIVLMDGQVGDNTLITRRIENFSNNNREYDKRAEFLWQLENRFAPCSSYTPN